MTQTQTAAIRAHLRRGRSITALDALKRWGVLRLAARIAELRAAGDEIHAQMVEVSGGKRVARYRLVR